MEKKVSRLFSRALTVLLVLSVVICLFVFSQVLIKGYVSVFGYSLFRVVTPSMEPTLPIGTLILTHEEDISDIKEEDIVSFVSKEKYLKEMIITHRVVDKGTNADGKILLVTRGDANPSADVYAVDCENLVGKMVWFSSEGNVFASIIAFLSGRAGFFTCIVLPVILLAVFMTARSVKSMAKEIRRLREATENEIEGTDEHTSDFSEKACEESYEEMCARIRKELEEELKRENDREKNKKQ